MAKLTAEQRLEKTHVSLMRNEKFCLFSGLFMIGKIEVRDDMPTAATDGVNVFYGRAFIESLDDKQLAFLVLHEAMHKAYRHLTTWERLYKKDAMLANAACDYVINLQISDYDSSETYVRMPTDKEGKVMGLIDEKYRGMDAGQVFAMLEKQQNGSSGSGSSQSGNSSDKDASSVNVPKGFDEHMWEEAIQMDGKEAEQIAKDIDNALRQGVLLAGKMSGEVPRDIQELITPKIDWRQVLRDFIKQIARGRDDSSWRRYNRRMLGSNIYMPQSVSTCMGCVVIGVDTSGSVGGDMLTEFLTEVKAVCNEVTPSRVELLYWDTAVVRNEVYEAGTIDGIVESTKPMGGGGTDPNCVPKFITDCDIHPECVIMLTDGYFYKDEGNWDSVSAPLLWCVKDNAKFIPKNGKVVHI